MAEEGTYRRAYLMSDDEIALVLRALRAQGSTETAMGLEAQTVTQPVRGEDNPIERAATVAKFVAELCAGNPRHAVTCLVEVLAEFLKAGSSSDERLAANYARTCTALNKFTHQPNLFIAREEQA
jgi:hypothetical protein